MRFVPPVALLADGPSSFVGDPHASQRPMAPLLDGLRQLGAVVTGDALPFTLTPPSRPRGRPTIDASGSSQFVSGLLLIGARLPRGLTLRHTGDRLPSRPHIEMTAEMLRELGVQVAEPDDRTWQVAPGPDRGHRSRTIEPDLTNAAVFLAAAAVTGGEVTVPGWPTRSLQPGALFLDVVTAMGADVDRRGRPGDRRGDGPPHGHRRGPHHRLRAHPRGGGAGGARRGHHHHPRGRPHPWARDGPARGPGRRAAPGWAPRPRRPRTGSASSAAAEELRPAVLHTYADHRMVHFAALLALRVPGIAVTDLDCVSKTMPHFARDWHGLVGR